jgi:hypothetical protein
LNICPGKKLFKTETQTFGSIKIFIYQKILDKYLFPSLILIKKWMPFLYVGKFIDICSNIYETHISWWSFLYACFNNLR